MTIRDEVLTILERATEPMLSSRIQLLTGYTYVQIAMPLRHLKQCNKIYYVDRKWSAVCPKNRPEPSTYYQDKEREIMRCG